MMFSRKFINAAVERAVKTFAQVLAALLVASGTGLLDTDWVGALSTSGMAALLSLLTSIASGTGGGGPSATNAEQLP